MDNWNSDQILYIFQYLNVRELNSVSTVSRRYYYLVLEYRRLLGPELVTVNCIEASHAGIKALFVLVEEPYETLQTKPNLILAFTKTSSGPTLSQELSNPRTSTKLPMSTPFVEVRSNDLQYSFPQQNQEEGVESRSPCVAMFANFGTNSTIETFLFDDTENSSAPNYGEYVQSLEEKRCNKDVDWKSFIVYACGLIRDGALESFIELVQTTYPKAIIVGGICQEGHVNYYDSTIETHGRKLIENGIFGVAMGGEIPMRSVVSRGVKSLVQQGTPLSTSSIKVVSAEIRRQDGDENGDRYHALTQFKNDSGYVMTFHDMLEQYSQPDFVGVRRPTEDGFQIVDAHPDWFAGNVIELDVNDTEEDATYYENSEIDLYELDGEACKDDIRLKMTLLKEQTKDEQILGALIFTCNGRGPKSGWLIDSSMYEATCFAEVFPQVPCLGFYAGGEIGPEVIVARQNAFQTCNTKVQGFTAVFALFIVPKSNKWVRHNLDDSPEPVKSFCVRTLCGSSMAED